MIATPWHSLGDRLGQVSHCVSVLAGLRLVADGPSRISTYKELEPRSRAPAEQVMDTRHTVSAPEWHAVRSQFGSMLQQVFLCLGVPQAGMAAAYLAKSCIELVRLA